MRLSGQTLVYIWEKSEGALDYPGHVMTCRPSILPWCMALRWPACTGLVSWAGWWQWRVVMAWSQCMMLTYLKLCRNKQSPRRYPLAARPL